MVGYGFTILSETPCADPHAGCCGGWGLETPGYPIRYEQRKIYSSSTTKLAKWEHGLSIFTALDSNNRLELLADNIESAKFAEHSHILI